MAGSMEPAQPWAVMEIKCSTGANYRCCFINQLNLKSSCPLCSPPYSKKGVRHRSTVASLNHLRLARHHQPTPHRVNGAVSPCQVQVHQSVGLGQETVEGLGREDRGVAGEGVTESLYPWLQGREPRP